MRSPIGSGLRPWMSFTIALAIVVPLSLAFILGGPMIGLLAGILAAVAVVTVAIRQPPDDRSGPRA